MANKTITPSKGQSVFDLAIQYYGSTSYLTEVFKSLGNVPITDEVTVAEIVLMNTRDNPTTDFLSRRRPLATANVDFSEELITQAGELVLTQSGETILI